MKRITTFILIALVAACARATTGAGNQLTGAPAPRLAVEQFLNAVRAQDLQAMSVIFGTSKGPARDLIERSELEKRLIIMQCFFNNDKFRILSENIQGGRHNFQIELTRGTRVRQTSAQSVMGPSERWYVESLDIASVRDFCAEQNPS